MLCIPRAGQEDKFLERQRLWNDAMTAAGCAQAFLGRRDGEVRVYTVWPSLASLQTFAKTGELELTRRAPATQLLLRMQVRQSDVLAAFAPEPAPAAPLKDAALYVVTYLVRDGARAQAVARLKARSAALARTAGFAGGELTADRADPRRLVLAARFTGDAALAGWRDGGERTADMETPLAELLTSTETATYA